MNAGGGIDTLRFDLPTDQTIGAGFQLPMTIEQLSLGIKNNATITLDPGFQIGNTLHTADGSFGTLINKADLTATGSAIVADIFAGVTVDNRANVTANLTSWTDAAVEINAYGSLVNSGTIDGRGGLGVTLDLGKFTNSGTITADQTAVKLFNPDGSNSGTILSRNGVGLEATGNAGIVFNNSGRIEGAVSGVISSIVIDNSGTIVGGYTGVELNPYGGLYNRAGGIIAGPNLAVGSGIYNFTFNAQLYNAGIINGDVNLGNFPSYYGSNNIVVLLPGGVINGNLHLGSGNDTLVTDMVNLGTGALAGITGSVTGGGSETLRYRVSQNSSANYVAPAGFAAVGYDLYNGAKLSLDLSENSPGPLWLAGKGSVDLTGALTINNEPLISTRSVLGEPGSTIPPTALVLTNNGHLTLTRTNASYGATGAVQLGVDDVFINNGTISTLNGGGAYPFSAISGGTVTNAGTIELDAGVAVADPVSFRNSGTIRQLSAAAAVTGISGFYLQDVTNSGRIEVDDVAVSFGYGANFATLDNSGTIISAANDAVSATSYSPITIANRSGGVISASAGHYAVNARGGTLVNAGTMNGDVLLDSYINRGIYVADGGTLNGDLVFGSADDIFLTQSGITGVNGTIDAGAGTDLFGRVYRTDATVEIGASLPITFEGELVESVGADTKVTLADSGLPMSNNLWLAGDGKVINKAAIGGRVTAFDDASVALDGVGVLASFTNDGDLGGGFGGAVKGFVNNGAIGSATLVNYPVYLSVPDDLSFSNYGTITAGSAGYLAASLSSDGARDFYVQNSGAIIGGLFANAFLAGSQSPASATISNTGDLSTASTSGGANALHVYAYAESGSASLVVSNSGSIKADRDGGAAVVLDVSVGSSGFPFGNFSSGDLSSVKFINSGSINSTGDGIQQNWNPPYYYNYNLPSAAISARGDFSGAVNIVNQVGGTINSSGEYSVAVATGGPALSLDNAGAISGGPGTTITTSLFGGAVIISNYLPGAIQGGARDDTVRNSGTIIGSIDLGDGNDSIKNLGALSGDVFLSGGDDRFVEGLGATFDGKADGGDGSDTLLFDVTGGGTLTASLYNQFVSFENFGLTGQGSISVQGVLPVQTLLLDDATFELDQGSTLQTLGPVAITGTGGDDHVINRGTIIGDVMLGGGNDAFDVQPGSAVSGSVNGGAGSDKLRLYFGETSTSPTVINFLPYSSFERFALGGGFGALDSTVGFDSIDVEGGRLVGLAGSTINAPQGINVASGATFGSTGTVNANVIVGGILSPGASPGTMTINGDVVLSSGSATFFEMTPTVSDALVFNGSLSIATNATLNITGNRPLTPGASYDLITASDGISGSFTNIAQAAGVLGFVRQSTEAIQLLGQFQLKPGSNTQVELTVDYINRLLREGAAGGGLLAAMPRLIDTAGFADPAIFARLNAEPYAGASQIGVENGLALSNALRTAWLPLGREHVGVFGFGQGFGAWRRLPGNPVRGTSAANVRSSGMFGGLGFGGDKLALGAFIGRIDARQNVSALGASTKSNGTVAGIVAKADLSHINLNLSVSWDGSSSDTTRSVLGGSSTSSHYRLRSWVLDGTISYDAAISGNVSLQPEIGFTHIASRRGHAAETGAGAFDLDVARYSSKADFISGQIKLKSAASASFRPSIAAGARRQLRGMGSRASASFIGSGSDLMTITGAARNSTLVLASGGVEIDISRSLTAFVNGRTEFGADSNGEAIGAGFRIGF